MSHPWARFRRNANLTQQQVGAHLNIDRLSIIRYEQGMFGSVSEELLDSLSQLYNVDKELLAQEYRGYQRITRLEFKAQYRSFWVVLEYKERYQGKLHPLIYYRNHYELSRNGLCKGLCLDYGPVSNYEKNVQRALPEALKVACEDIGWNWEPLDKAVLEWRASGRSSIK